MSEETLRVKLGIVGLVIALTAAHLRWPRFHAVHAAILIGSLTAVWLSVEPGH